VSLGVVGDGFFSFFPKIVDSEEILDTLGDALEIQSSKTVLWVFNHLISLIFGRKF
jgi:hypothetical protein